MVTRVAQQYLSPAYVWQPEARVFARTAADGEFAYSDGDATEDMLLATLRDTTDLSLDSPTLAAAIVDWPTRYHLGAGRAHLLRPLARLLGGTTLEVGAGCGALTRYLGELGGTVVALEGSRRRATITASRCRDLDNVIVCHDRLDRFEGAGRFSAVTLVGVLEWAARVDDGPDAARAMLAQAAALLDDDGVLIVATENQLGLKYLAGWPEDHLGTVMTGVNDAYRPDEPRTYGLGELSALVAGAGLAHQSVFAPFPDYKFPRIVVSPAGLDERAWAEDLAGLVGATPVADPQPLPLPVFSLEQALALAARNGVLRGVANAFLLVASRSPRVLGGEDVLAWHYGGDRRVESRRETRFRRSARGLTIERRALDAPADSVAPASEPFVPGRQWILELGRILNRPGWTIDEVARWATPWRDAVQREASLRHPAASAVVPSRLVDATPFNMVERQGEHQFFDLEWQPDWQVEYGFVIFRGLYWSVSRFRSVATPAEGVPLNVPALAAQLTASLGTPLADHDVARYLALEASLQADVAGWSSESVVHRLSEQRLEARREATVLARLNHDVEAIGEHARHTERLLQGTQQRLADVQAEAQAIEARHRQTIATLQAELAASHRTQEAARGDAARAQQEAADAGEALLRAREARDTADEARRNAQAAADTAGRRAAQLAGKMKGLRAAALVSQRLVEQSTDRERRGRHQVAARAARRLTQPATLGRGPVARARQRLRDSHVPLGWATRHPLRLLRGLLRLRHREFRLQVDQLAASRLLDAAYYRAATGTGADTSPATRFLLGGDAALERPHPLFDPRWYLDTHRDLPAGTPPLLHYIRHGGWEMRSPHPLFDPRHYVSQWPHGTISSLTPLTHFLEVGDLGAASPHPLFDAAFYLAQAPGLGEAGANPLVHYLTAGHLEGLDPHPLFSTRHYRETYPDIGEQNPLEHYVRHGAVEGRSPHPLFDPAFYWQRRPDVRGTNPLGHYLAFGSHEALDPHPLFDSVHYLSQLGGTLAPGTTPLVHYVTVGWRAGLRPNRWFDPLWYLERNPDLRDVEPLRHFARHGWREGRDPSAEFSLATYQARYADVAAAGENPLAHFVRLGHAEGRTLDGRPVESMPPVHLEFVGTVTAPPTILCVSHVSPWPVGAGNEYRLSRMLDHLRSRGHRIVLVLAPLPGEGLADGALEHLAARYGNVIVCEASGRVEFRLADCPDVLTPLARDPLATTFATEPGPDLAFCPDVVVGVVKALAEALGRVALVAEYIFMTRVFPLLSSDVLKVVDTIDVFSQKGANVIAYGIGDSETPAADEARLLQRADLVVAIHTADAEALRRLVPRREVIVTGVDADVRADTAWPARPTLLLPGSGNPLNVMGLRDFLKFAWPRVRAAVPGAELRVAGHVGRSVPPGTPGVAVLGRVPDLADEYAAARVVINPAVAGTGLKIKTVEALAHLRPVVGWPHNRDGLSPELTPFVDEVVSWDAFADETIRRLQAGTSPFDAAAVAAITRALSADTTYRTLNDALARFFHPSSAGQG